MIENKTRQSNYRNSQYSVNERYALFKVRSVLLIVKKKIPIIRFFYYKIGNLVACF